ncbi:hypothetical protein DWG18_08810 [Lysobacter sp. TY2-98]|uniref:hypothetical protein n=1 Tax=Lysobacter sp. TY2-98 TaxID=2290922 RepID=UPI000E20B526|nr:hypothetical protein [Lysobacter sp. TY2-98]AXK72363.1 hypothetical protein DWG18_08810 [Lysobacter sp. TY2-98]
MVKTIRVSIGFMLLAMGSYAHAQAATTCPTLPADSGLTWETKTAGGTQFCRAMRPDGSEAFGLYMAAQSAFKPNRGDRAEEAQIDGRATYWYRSELAGQPDVQARETLIPLPDGRVAYLWIQAPSKEALTQAITQTNALHFGTGGSAQLTSK